MCIWDSQCFQSFRNCCLFCTFWLIRNFSFGEAHHANYGKHSLNHHFQHCTHSVYKFYNILKLFQIAVFFCTFWLIRNFYSGEAHHANYGKHSLNHHFQHCAHCAYDIYSIFKVFEMAVCFAHFRLFEIWTALILSMLAMVNILQFIISNIAQSVYMRFTVFSKFSKLLLVLYILADSKFLLRWGASCQLKQTYFKSSFPTLCTQSISDFQYFQSFRNCFLFCTFWLIRNFYSGEAHHAN